MAEDGGISLRGALKQAGYSQAVADSPAKVTESKGFLELVEEFLPDWRLAEVHGEGLSAMRISRDKFGDKYEDPDYYARHQYLETAYKIKGRLNPPNSDKTGDINITLTLYGNEKPNNTVSISAKAIPITVPSSDGRRIQKGRDSLAQAQREGQDSSASSD